MTPSPPDHAIRAVVFDFDGLILETETPALEAWAAVYQLCSLPFPRARFLEEVGRADYTFDPVAELLSTGTHRLTREALLAAYRARNRECLALQAPLPGVLDYLEAARAEGLRVGLASSSPRSWVESHLERLGLLSRFEVIRCRDDVAQGKPWPDLYLSVLRSFGIAGPQAVALEDSRNGMLAAKRAGLWCVAVPNPTTAGHSFDLADHVLPSLSALPLADLLRRLQAGARTAGNPAPRHASDSAL